MHGPRLRGRRAAPTRRRTWLYARRAAQPQRVEPWEYDRVTYHHRNEVERLFRRLKGYRRVFTRFDKLDAMFIAFVHLALIFDALR